MAVCLCMSYMFHLSSGRRLTDIKHLENGLNSGIGDVPVPHSIVSLCLKQVRFQNDVQIMSISCM